MITPLLDQTTIQALAWSLVHFLWQGAVLGLVAFVLLRMSGLGATTRYFVGVGTLTAMLAAPIVTFVIINGRDAAPVRNAAAATVAEIHDAQDARAAATVTRVDESSMTIPDRQASVAPARPLGPFVILIVWLSGVVLLSLRLLGGWIVARRLITRAVRPVSADIHSLVRRVAGRMALDRAVRVFESSAVAVPVMVGWIKPVVLLPAAALSGLTPTQVEALIAHELAHVRRNDYIVNLLQSVVETLLFYHPAVWWVSARIRAEREHCCDDLAIAVCDRLVYVTALADLAAMTTTPRVALAATDGSLVNRVRRILGRSRDASEVSSSWVPAVVLALVVGATVPASFALASGNGPARVWEQEPKFRASAMRPYVPTQSLARAEVVGGVQGGIADGVPGGISGGVSGVTADGVSGGIPSGVPGGIPGGVSGGIALDKLATVAGLHVAEAHEGLLGDAALKAAVADPGQWRIEQDSAKRWRLVKPGPIVKPFAIKWRFDKLPGGQLRLVREGQIRPGRSPELDQAEAALRDRIAQLQAELQELRRHYEEMQRKYGQLAFPNKDTFAAGQLSALGLAKEDKTFELLLEHNKLADKNQLLAQQYELAKLFSAKSAEDALFRQQIEDSHLRLLAEQEKQRDAIALAHQLDADKLLREQRALSELFTSKAPAFQGGATTQGSGNWVWSDNDERVAVKWTGAFRISDDDKDIVWVEPGKSVTVSDGSKMFSTGVEVKGLADGKVERTYFRNGFGRAFEPEGREFLASMLQKIVRRSGFGAETRVERFLKQGGVPAVLAEIETLQGDYARRVYYRELFKQAKVSPAELTKIVTRASETIQSDYELASLLVSAVAQAPGDEAARVAVIGATRTIGSDYEMRRALSAALATTTTAKTSAAVLEAAAGIGSDYERARLLIELAQKGGLTSATKSAYFELVKTLRSSHEQGRVLRSVAALPNVPEDVIADAVKSSQAMSGDYERRQFLAQSIARQPVTSKSAGDVIQAAAGIRSDNEQATLLVDLVRRGGLTDETAASFFPVVASMTSSYEQRRVLQAVLAATGQLSETIVTGLLKSTANIANAYERAEILVAVSRKQSLSAAGRNLYLAAADTIKSEHDQTRVYAALVRAERTRK